MQELWLDIEGYEGLYLISNTGKVKSLISNKILRGSLDKDGYNQVVLYKNGKGKTRKVHRLVGLSFIPNPENKPVINHIDCVRDNNVVSNLEWATHKENVNHGNATQLRAEKQSVPIIQYTKDGQYVNTYDSAMEAGRQLGIAQGNISKVCRGQNKTAYGYIWKYAI